MKPLQQKASIFIRLLSNPVFLIIMVSIIYIYMYKSGQQVPTLQNVVTTRIITDIDLQDMREITSKTSPVIVQEESKKNWIIWAILGATIALAALAAAYKYSLFGFSTSTSVTNNPSTVDVAPLESSPAEIDKLKEYWPLIEHAYGKALTDVTTARQYNVNLIYNINIETFMAQYAKLAEYSEQYIVTYRLAIKHLFYAIDLKPHSTTEELLAILSLTFHSENPDILQYPGYDYVSSLELLEYTNYQLIIFSLIVIMLLFLAYIIIKNNMVNLKNILSIVITVRNLVYEYITNNLIRSIIYVIILTLLAYLIYIVTISLLLIGFIMNLIMNLL